LAKKLWTKRIASSICSKALANTGGTTTGRHSPL
jgi:hypothetical protein